jgi:hypothetical protein
VDYWNDGSVFVKKTSALAWIVAVATVLVPSYAQKKKTTKPPLPPTQADIIKECVELRNITFEHRGGPFSNKNTGVSGTIKNVCAHEGQVSIAISFYDSSGNEIDLELVKKLVGPGSALPFWGGPAWDSVLARDAATGRVTDVYWRSTP